MRMEERPASGSGSGLKRACEIMQEAWRVERQVGMQPVGALGQ
jgi:hypothetical protein